MSKTYREYAIDYIKNRRLCKGYVDYIVEQLNKLEQIEQIVEEWNNDTEKDIESFDTMKRIEEVLNG